MGALTMCGIAAILAGRGEVDAVRSAEVPALLQIMCDAIQHRGPDGEGRCVFPFAALGHRRLAILDIEGGAQPMGSADGKVQVVFNGEIYNHHQLRQRLSDQGASFHTRCDTEVLVEGFREYGTQLPGMLRGMFAFAAHDRESGETLLARDPLGKKPLYYAQLGPLVLVASETRCFLELPGFARQVDGEALRELLALRYVPGNRSLISGIRELPPGHYALHRPGEEILPRPYWRPDFGQSSYEAGAPGTKSFDEETGRLRQLFTDCVQARMESDVPLGAFLSGGVDSSGVVAAMAESGQQQLSAVTVGFDDGRVDERVYAREVAERFSVRLHEQVLRPDPQRDLLRLAEIADEPLFDSSLWPTLLVSEAARREVTVAISGDGGDESFAGYRRYRFDRFEHSLRRFIPRPLAALGGALFPKADFLPQRLRCKRTLQGLGRSPARAYFRSVSALVPEEVDALCGPGIDPFRELQAIYDRATAPDHATRILELDLVSNLPGDILRKVDRASMHVSLEVRSPLLDRELVEYAAGLPGKYKYDAHTGKRILKKAFQPWLGAEFLARPKQGFVIPLSQWLRTELREARDAAISGNFAQTWFDRDVLNRAAREHDSGRRDHGELLWAVLMLELWHERWGRR
ncbi:MAG: asparagine synthase (glutamine-hydrolyzing) [Planctomycetota bacterium]|nr:MAG: asparagine synthase (glutamine-hydrolyzing) [Planctomycetota bacterium]